MHTYEGTETHEFSHSHLKYLYWEVGLSDSKNDAFSTLLCIIPTI